MAQEHPSHPELVTARACAERGDFNQALHHIEVASMEGADPSDIQREQIALEALRRGYFNSRAERIGFAVAVPFVCYLLLSVAEPPSYGTLVWAALALLAVPLLTGLAMAKLTNGFSRGWLFQRSFLLAGFAMAIYTVIHLAAIRNRIAEQADSVAVLAVSAFVTMVYAICAGLVAGLLSAILAREVPT